MIRRAATSGMSGATQDQSILATSFRIGRLEIPNRVVLAPMAGFTTSAYRQHLKEYGVGLVFTEMVSAYGLVYGNTRTVDYLRFVPAERPIAVQLFGDSPEIMARAAELVLSRPNVPDLLDVNMGCPVRKVMKTGAGAALLADPERAVAVAAAVVRVASSLGVPVTVKLRSGLHRGERLALDLAPRLEAVGIQALTVHPRAAEDHYRGHADHSLTAEVARAVSIPVIASGDIHNGAVALKLVLDTGAAAVMLARGALGDPWLVRSLLDHGERKRPSLEEAVADLRRLLAKVSAEMGPERGVRWIRKLLGRYLRPAGVASTTLRELQILSSAEALDRALAALEKGRPVPAPNLMAVDK